MSREPPKNCGKNLRKLRNELKKELAELKRQQCVEESAEEQQQQQRIEYLEKELMKLKRKRRLKNLEKELHTLKSGKTPNQ